MKPYIFFLFLIFFSHTKAQNFLLNSDSLSIYISKNNITHLERILPDLEISIKEINKYCSKNKFDEFYINRLRKDNYNPETYITYSEYPKIYSSNEILKLFQEKKEDIDYYTYFNKKGFSVFLDDLPYYSKFPFLKNLNLKLVSSYSNKSELKQSDFKSYKKIDSIKVFYSYRFPLKIDTMRIKVDNIKSKTNKYNISIKRLNDYGLVIDVPFKKNLKIIDISPIDKSGRILHSSDILQQYFNLKSDDDNVLTSLASSYTILTKLYDQIAYRDILTVNDLITSLSSLKKEYTNYKPIEELILSKKYLFQIYGITEEVIVYLETQEGSIFEEVIIKKETHPIYDTFIDDSLEWDKPNVFFYNKNDEKIIDDNAYFSIEFLGNNLFEVQNQNREKEILFVNDDGLIMKKI